MDFNEIKTISRQIDSPSFYIFDAEKFRRSFRALESAFKSCYPAYRIAYSFKTNYCPEVVKNVKSLGGAAEIVSDFEYEIALKAGFRPEDIIYNGPVKDFNTCMRLLNAGGCVIADNESELRKLISLRPREGVWNLGLRCNLNMGTDKISRFGFDTESADFPRILDLVQDNFNLKILHCHISGYRELEYWAARAKKLCAIAKSLRKLPEIIDLGSGMFGQMEPCFKKQFNKYVPEFSEYAELISSVFLEEFSALPEDRLPVIYTEPGTTLVANAFNFYCPVVSFKNIRGKDFIQLLGSIHNIGTELAVKKNLPCTLIKNPGIKNRRCFSHAELVGYTCLEYDSLQRDFSGEAAEGDYFEFRNTGSYSNVLKPPFIMPDFPMLVIEEGKPRIIKRKENNSDLFGAYTF